MQELIQWLMTQHDRIMNSENEAYAELDNGNREGYATKMREKATLLRDLHKSALPFIKRLPEKDQYAIDQVISRFSSSAATGLALDSLFYMSALLYRDDHKAGEPDNLAVFIDSLKRRAA